MVGFSPSERSLDIGTNGRYPDRIKSHSLDIIKFIDDTPPVSTAIPSHLGITISIVPTRQSESISHDPTHQPDLRIAARARGWYDVLVDGP